MSKGDRKYDVRLPGDLDRSIRERVAGGSLKSTMDPAARPPGRGLSVSVEGDGLRLSARGTPAKVVGSGALVLAGSVVFVLGKSGYPPVPALPEWVPLLALGFGFLALCYNLLVAEEMAVSPQEVHSWWMVAGLMVAESALPAEEVEEVVINDLGRGDGLKLVKVISDSQIISFGRRLSRAQRRWARDCITAVLSAPPAAGGGDSGDR